MKEELHKLIDNLLLASEELETQIKHNTLLDQLTSRQLVCIAFVKNRKNPTVSEIAKAMNITKPSATALIERLIQSNYLLKVKSDSDRRVTHVHLTSYGIKAATLHENIHVQFAKYIAEPLSAEEKETLKTLLKKSVHNLKTKHAL